MTDWELLQRYRNEHSEDAFAALYARYGKMVYAVCVRELSERTLAEDVTQAVFLLLAQKRMALRRGVVLSGWLFEAARLICRDVRKRDGRRVARERKAFEMSKQDLEAEQADQALWERIEPYLDDALDALRRRDRDIILLRVVEGRSLAEAGEALGISEDAARKRAARATEALRRNLRQAGVGVPALALIALLTKRASAVHSPNAPTLMSILETSPRVQSIYGGAIRTMTMAKIKTIVICLVCVLTAAGMGAAGARVSGLKHLTEGSARLVVMSALSASVIHDWQAEYDAVHSQPNRLTAQWVKLTPSTQRRETGVFQYAGTPDGRILLTSTYAGTPERNEQRAFNGADVMLTHALGPTRKGFDRLIGATPGPLLTYTYQTNEGFAFAPSCILVNPAWNVDATPQRFTASLTGSHALPNNRVELDLNAGDSGLATPCSIIFIRIGGHYVPKEFVYALQSERYTVTFDAYTTQHGAPLPTRYRYTVKTTSSNEQGQNLSFITTYSIRYEKLSDPSIFTLKPGATDQVITIHPGDHVEQVRPMPNP